ncbi:Na(+)-translocating NADH-quinone reductase subunit C [Aliidiomarina sedimenti]|uniref:Na(+)-translocating NADH-quinone reductase subunit C n=1 Tax=Aliidiomarina sedimenti TaxID=1933879 RepID=A0ABY0C306_9GAMM|nr:Na(+)-translocating NADH-quinone reductase subunit C [Aliidiomarina sedimenti]RUO32256.1 Na(+)-translocating NADH-quinone reductase subunit C [Aliidiomarina sedimenti]
MSKKNESTSKTFIVVIALCLVCSIIVSGAAVGLKDRQEANAALAMQRNVLQAARIDFPSGEAAGIYAERIREYRLNMETYELTSASEEELAAAADTESQGDVARRLSADEDVAGVRDLEQHTMFYVALGEDGESVESYILPIRGAGLWGMMYALLALESDGQTIAGLNFYDHSETPGLGGEIQNPRWVSNFEGKQAVDSQGNVEIRVTKGANPQDNEVDALSGATITSNGVDNTFQFWLSDTAYGPFLQKLREGEVL